MKLFICLVFCMISFAVGAAEAVDADLVNATLTQAGDSGTRKCISGTCDDKVLSGRWTDDRSKAADVFKQATTPGADADPNAISN